MPEKAAALDARVHVSGKGGMVVDKALSWGERVWLEGWRRWATVGRPLGAGSEGVVHEVVPDGAAAAPLALLWLRSDRATPELREAIARLVAAGLDDRFLWPLDLALIPGRAEFGFVMALRRPELASMYDLFRQDVDPSWRVLARVGMELADAFSQLHARGLCYGEANFGQVFFDPMTGDIAMCGYDTVVAIGTPARLLGTLGFEAPEVGRGERLPDVATARHSLAVLLFQMFVRHDPFLGRAEQRFRVLDHDAARYLWADHPVFIFDPGDRSNAPVPGEHLNPLTIWPLLPGFIRRLFTQVFTTGLVDPDTGRVTEREWRVAMARLRDLVWACPTCAAEQVFDPDGQEADLPCWSCATANRPPMRLRLERPGTTDIVVLGPDAVLHEHHLTDRRYVYENALATVTAHPTDPKRWGLTNQTRSPWQLSSGRGQQQVDPGRTVGLQPGTVVRFGSIKGMGTVDE